MSSTRFAYLATFGLLLAAGHARAEDAHDGAAPPTPAPPAAYVPPPGYAPHAAPLGWYPKPWPPYTPMKRRSPGMIAAGVVLVSLSSVALIAGPAMIVNSQQTSDDPCPFNGCTTQSNGGSGFEAAGITSIVLGVALGAAGVPLLVVGAQKVPDRGEASVVPVVRVGAGGASVAWRF
jgi:hypothetical protein